MMQNEKASLQGEQKREAHQLSPTNFLMAKEQDHSFSFSTTGNC